MILYSKILRNVSIASLILLGLIFSPIFLPFQKILAVNLSTSVTISITGCGNAAKEGSEQCDGTDLNEENCLSRGFTSGVLSCNSNCTFNTSNCVSAGGGGGGAVYVPLAVATKVIIEGKAYPEAQVTFLREGKVIAIKKSDFLANFKIEMADITPGIWTFSVWAEDKNGKRSTTFSFTTNVAKDMTTTVSGIFLPPTIELSKTKLQKGESLIISGQTAPESEISVHIESSELIEKTKATKKGAWRQDFNTEILEEGIHTTRAKAISPEGLISSFSQVLAFNIGKEAIGTVGLKTDLSKDGKVNLIDFSILLYWWGKLNSSVDQNGDGKVNLVDFSIIMYYWTG